MPIYQVLAQLSLVHDDCVLHVVAMMTDYSNNEVLASGLFSNFVVFIDLVPTMDC